MEEEMQLTLMMISQMTDGEEYLSVMQTKERVMMSGRKKWTEDTLNKKQADYDTGGRIRRIVSDSILAFRGRILVIDTPEAQSLSYKQDAKSSLKC
jgi:hypothetical protein